MTNGWPDFFVDTNLFVYPFDPDESVRGPLASEVLRRLQRSGTAAISAQVLSELSSVLLRKPRFGMTAADVATVVRGLASAWRVFPVTELVVLEAVRGVEQHRLSYYDAQLWAIAQVNSVSVLLSEDGPSGQNLGGVRFLNPLAESFDLDLLGPRY